MVNDSSMPVNETFTVESSVESTEPIDKSIDFVSTKETSLKSENEKRKEEDGGTFDKGIEFLLSCMGLSVGLGNIWRFPTRAYENGGSAFLIPYITCAILFGLPGVYLEFSLGQFCGRSPPFVYRRIMPVLEGFGWVAASVSAIVSIYFMLLIAWISVYLVNVVNGNSGKWGSCDNSWNDPATCFDIKSQSFCRGNSSVGWNSSAPIPDKMIFMNGSCHDFREFHNVTLSSASEQFFRNSVITPSSGLLDLNYINWPIFSAMVVMWILTVIVIKKGMKFIGKLSYATVILPYFIIVILFIRGITLDGASEGLRYFLLKPDFTKLWRYETWTAALIQLCFSLAIGFGGLMNTASYNSINHNCYRDAIFLILGDTTMSLIGGAAVFSTLGFLAKQRGVEVSEVIASGASLAFVAYPDAMNQMPIPWLWNFLFFFMLLLLGFMMVQVMSSCISDRFSWLGEKDVLVVGGISSILFTVGIVLTTDAGIYWFELFDEYGSGFGALISATSMCIIVGYLYGMNNFRMDLDQMMGQKEGRLSKFFGHNSYYYRFNWKFISPVFGLILIVLTGWRSYPYQNKPDVYPPIFDILGWTLALSPFLIVPLCAFSAYRKFKRENIPLRGLFMLQKSHPSFLRISSEWSERKQSIGDQLPSEESVKSENSSISKRKSDETDSETV
uniref:Transporter n=1 Tax=Caenorhabditis tropicalis TaxID=1561998 RepID=A0A1I7UJK5_9PELO